MTKKKITIYSIFGSILLLLGFSLLLVNKKSNLHSNGLIPKASNLIELADSIRNSNRDSALFYYNKAKILLEASNGDSEKSHLLGKTFVGLAYTYAEKGNNNLALQNDSLAMAIATVNDDKSIIAAVLIIRGTNLYRNGEYDKAMDCYQKGLDLALEINDLELQAKIAANRAMIYSHQGNNEKTTEGFLRALNIGKQLNNKSLIASNYLNLAVVYMNQSKNDSALIYSNSALELFKEINDKNGILKCYRNIGNIYYGLSDFGKTIEYYQLSLQISLEINDQLNAAKAYHNLSEIYIHLGDNSTATELLLKSIKIKEQTNDELSLAKGYMGFARLYYTRQDYPKALTYFRKALEINTELNSISEIGANYSGIASVYCSIDKIDSAIVLYNKTLELYKQIDYTHGISNTYINLGDVYRTKMDFQQSEKLLLQALKLKTGIEEEEGVAIVNCMLANLYVSMADAQNESMSATLLKKAEKAGIESYKTAKQLDVLPVMKDASSILMEIRQRQGNYKQALEYSRTFNSLNDSILNKAKIEALTFAEARWNIEKKQQEVDNLEKTQKLDQEVIAQKVTEARQHKYIIWILIVLFLLAAASIGIVALYIRKRREAQYQQQLSKMAALRMQNARNAMSPHFFFNVLASLNGLSNKPEQFARKLESLSLLLRKVIENIDRTAVSLDEELAAVKAFVDLSSDKIPQPFNVEYLIAEGAKLNGLIPAMMIQIPVENAIKHGLMPLEGAKKLTISVADFDEYQQILIAYNGIGLKASTGRSTGTGTGLKVLMQTIHLLNVKNHSKIKISVSEREPVNGQPSGTAVEIKIPYEFNYAL